MLKLFRDNLKSYSWLLWVFVFATLILWVMMDIPGLFNPEDSGGRNATAAEAGDTKVTFSEFERTYRQLEDTYSNIFQGNLPEGYRERLRQQAIQQALDRKLLIKEANRMGLKVPDKEVREQILEFPLFKTPEGAFIGNELYKRTVRRLDYGTPKEFESVVRSDLLYGKLMGILQASAFVTDDEVKESFREEVERAKLSYVLMPSARFGDQVTVEDADLQAYFDEHQNEYRLPEQRKVSYLLVDTAQLRASMEVSDEDLQAYYDANEAEYSQEEQVRARHILLKTDERTEAEAEAGILAIRKRIEAGEDFGAIAKESSEDPGSAANGGDLRFFPRGRMVPQFEEAAFKAQVGDLIGPIATPFGAHLLEVLGRRDAGVRPLEEVKAQVRHKVLTERVDAAGEQKAQELLARLNESSETTRASLEAVAEELDSVRFLETNAFGRQDLIPGIGRSEDFAAAAFDLKPNTMSDLVKIPRGWAVLLLEEVMEPRVPPMSEVDSQIRLAVRTEKQKAMAREALEGLKASMEAGEDLASAAAALDLEVKETEDLGRQGNVPELGATSNDLVLQALDMEEGQVGGPVAFPQGEVVFQVTSRTRMDPAEFDLRKDETRERLEGQRFAQVQQSVLNQLKRDLGSTYSPQIVDAVDGGLEAN